MKEVLRQELIICFSAVLDGGDRGSWYDMVAQTKESLVAGTPLDKDEVAVVLQELTDSETKDYWQESKMSAAVLDFRREVGVLPRPPARKVVDNSVLQRVVDTVLAELTLSGKVKKPITVRIKNCRGGRAHPDRKITLPSWLSNDEAVAWQLNRVFDAAKKYGVKCGVLDIDEYRRNYVLHEVAHVLAGNRRLGHCKRYYWILEDIGGKVIYDIEYKPRSVLSCLWRAEKKELALQAPDKLWCDPINDPRIKKETVNAN